jgi:hypothetical protein
LQHEWLVKHNVVPSAAIAATSTGARMRELNAGATSTKVTG